MFSAHRFRRWLMLLALLASTAHADRFDKLQEQAPQLAPQALRAALAALDCAGSGGAHPARRLALIDYSLPSAQQRLWLFDLQAERLLLRDFVAHGRASGEFIAEHFSNLTGSHQSSLGLFIGAESYVGRHGYALRLDGLEPGLNDQARSRALVLHGADYVAPELVASQGRMGRSQGCPAVRKEISRWLVNQLKDGQYLFAWHPQLGTTRYQRCEPFSVARSAE